MTVNRVNDEYLVVNMADGTRLIRIMGDKKFLDGIQRQVSEGRPPVLNHNDDEPNVEHNLAPTLNFTREEGPRDRKWKKNRKRKTHQPPTTENLTNNAQEHNLAPTLKF